MDVIGERVNRLEIYQAKLLILKDQEDRERKEDSEDRARKLEERSRRRNEIFGATIQELSSQAEATQLRVQEMQVEAEQLDFRLKEVAEIQKIQESGTKQLIGTLSKNQEDIMHRLHKVETARMFREEDGAKTASRKEIDDLLQTPFTPKHRMSDTKDNPARNSATTDEIREKLLSGYPTYYDWSARKKNEEKELNEKMNRSHFGEQRRPETTQDVRRGAGANSRNGRLYEPRSSIEKDWEEDDFADGYEEYNFLQSSVRDTPQRTYHSNNPNRNVRSREDNHDSRQNGTRTRAGADSTRENDFSNSRNNNSNSSTLMNSTSNLALLSEASYMVELQQTMIQYRTPPVPWPHKEMTQLTVSKVYEFIDAVFKFTQSYQQPVNIVTALSPTVTKMIIAQATRTNINCSNINKPENFQTLLTVMIELVQPTSPQQLIKDYESCVQFPEVMVKGGLGGITPLAWACLSLIDQTRLFFDAFHSTEVLLLPTNKAGGSLYYILQKLPKNVVDCIITRQDVPRYTNSPVSPLNQVLTILEQRIQDAMIRDAKNAQRFLSNFEGEPAQVERPIREYYPSYNKQSTSIPMPTVPRKATLHQLQTDTQDAADNDEQQFEMEEDFPEYCHLTGQQRTLEEREQNMLPTPLDDMYQLGHEAKKTLFRDYLKDNTDQPGRKGCFRMLWKGYCNFRWCRWSHDAQDLQEAWLSHQDMLANSTYAPANHGLKQRQHTRVSVPSANAEMRRDNTPVIQPKSNQHIRFSTPPETTSTQPWQGTYQESRTTNRRPSGKVAGHSQIEEHLK